MNRIKCLDVEDVVRGERKIGEGERERENKKRRKWEVE